MWINKNVYLYEKKLKETRIETLEGQVAILTKKLEAAYKEQPVKPSDAYTEPSPISKQEQALLQERFARDVAGQRQADHLNPFLTQNERSCARPKQVSALSGSRNPLSIAFGGAFG